MSNTRPELSKKNRYWIDRHRYYELKHFCLQYPSWKRAYRMANGTSGNASHGRTGSNDVTWSDPTAYYAEMRLDYRAHIDLVEKAAQEAGGDLFSYLLVAVTEGLSYEGLQSRFNIPCCKDTYYEMYRRFFWILSRTRN